MECNSIYQCFICLQDDFQLQLTLFQLYHNKRELTEKREIAEKKKDEVTKLEKRKEISDDEIKTKRKELAIYNKELATDEQKIKELVFIIFQSVVVFIYQLRIFYFIFNRKLKSIKIVQYTLKQKKIQYIIRKNSILLSKKVIY